MSETLSTVRTQLSIYLNDTGDGIWSETQKNHAINAAIRSAYPSWFTETISSNGSSNWIVVCDEQLEYTLPTMRRLLGVKVEVANEYYSGTATNADSDSLEDSGAAWTVDEYAPAADGSSFYHVVLYDGVGKGDYAKISSNTATSVELTTSGYDWTGAVEGGATKYMIKNMYKRTRDWRTISSYRTNTLENPSTLYLTGRYISGMYLQLHYLAAPSELSDDADTTDVPMQWLIHQASANLQMIRMREEPGFENKNTTDMFTVDQNLAEEYREKHSMRFPPDTIRTERESGYYAVPDEYPF